MAKRRTASQVEKQEAQPVEPPADAPADTLGPPNWAERGEPPVLTIAELTPDPVNRRGHSARNLAMLRDALAHVGAARSIVIDEDNVILAGNGVVSAATDAGLTHVRVIDADGDEVIAVRRSNLTPEQKRLLAMYDNRTAELATWNADQLAADQRAGLSLAEFFTAQELAATLKNSMLQAPGAFGAVDETVETQYCCPKCGYEWSGKPAPGLGETVMPHPQESTEPA